MTKLGEGNDQTGGGESGGSSEKFCDENFDQNGKNWFCAHRGFQINPFLPVQIFFSPWKWPSKLKYHFFKYSFSQPTSESKWVGEPDYLYLQCLHGERGSSLHTSPPSSSRFPLTQFSPRSPPIQSVQCYPCRQWIFANRKILDHNRGQLYQTICLCYMFNMLCYVYSRQYVWYVITYQTYCLE